MYFELFSAQINGLGNDHCNETKASVLKISKNSAILWQSGDLSPAISFVAFDEVASQGLFTSGSTYSWVVTETKGKQVVSASSSFEYCTPKQQDVVCSAGSL